jgi:MoxR-like ATPase
VFVSDAVKGYILDLVAGTRESPDTEHGASPRASIAFLNASKARAAVDGREYVIPDDVKSLAEPVLAHRLVLSTDAELGDVSSTEVVREVVASVTPPGGEEPGAEVDAEPGTGDEGTEAVGDGGDTVADPVDPDSGSGGEG